MQRLKGSASLSLGRGLVFCFQAYDEESAKILEHFSKTMRMFPDNLSKPDATIQIKRGIADSCGFPLVICVMASSDLAYKTFSIYFDNASRKADIVLRYLWQLSLPIVHRAEILGGLLLHGALVVKDGYGIILAGPSEAGKTTASIRIPHPWQTLSDDCALLIKTGSGYMAHPWPTWSRFINNQGEGTWEIGKAVPLRGIFFLRKSETDCIDEINKAQAACMLIESAEQVSAPAEWIEQFEDMRIMRTRRLDNLCSLVRSIPSFLLSISIDGEFWELIENSLDRTCVGS